MENIKANIKFAIINNICYNISCLIKRSVNFIFRNKLFYYTKKSFKFIIFLIIASFVIIAMVGLKYKPVYKVTFLGENAGYVQNKNSFEKLIEEEILTSSESNVAFVTLNSLPSFELKFIDKTITTNEDEIFAKKKANSETTYEMYAITLNGENKSYVNTLEEALEIKDGDSTLNDRLVALVAKIGEKISFRRFEKITKNDDEIFGTYKHMGGKIGTVVVLKGANEEVAKDVAMQTAAMNPTALNRSLVPQEVIDRESKVIKEQVMAEGKPEDIAEKMVVGRLNKFYKEICLEEQAFIKDSGLSVKDYVKNNGGEIISMTRFAVGEGIQKREENFADEVMSQIKNS